jgi:predicted DNA-binding protein with PD1-like motif
VQYTWSRADKTGNRQGVMNTCKHLSFAFALLIVACAIMYSQKIQAGYVSPSQAIPKGKAPGMQVQLLGEGTQGKEYAVIFAKGDEAHSGLLEFAERYHVGSAHFTAIGALSSATVAWFDPDRKLYKAIPIDRQVEVLSMVGDIALYNAEPTVHTHMVVGFPDGTARGGHVLEAHVFPTLEVMVTVDPIDMRKRLDPDTDLTLIDPSLLSDRDTRRTINKEGVK